MELAKLLLFSIFLLLIFVDFTSSDPLITSTEDQNDTVHQANAADASLDLELQQLMSKFSLLETSILENLDKLRTKDESIKELDKIAKEKSSSLASLQNELEIELLQRKGSLDAKEKALKVDEQASKLEKQIVILKKEIERQNRKTDESETRANAEEKKIEGMKLKLESLRQISDEQRSKIHKTEYALQVAEEEMLKAKLEASSISQQVKEVYQAWLPPWLSLHLGYCKTVVVANWKEHAKPALDVAIEQVLEKLSQVEKWAQPHFDTLKEKWIPATKEHCITFASDIKPQVQSLATKALDFCQLSKETLGPQIVKFQEIIDPYVQEVKRFTKPHIDHVTKISKPHVDKPCVFLKSFLKRVFHNFKKIIKNARIYRSQVQAYLVEALNSYELTKPLATEDELVLFMTAILMALPSTFLCSPIITGLILLLRKKPTKLARKTHTGHTRRRVKREHVTREYVQDS